jgi:hypothetical protein
MFLMMVCDNKCLSFGIFSIIFSSFLDNVSEAGSVSIIMCKVDKIRTQFCPFEKKNIAFDEWSDYSRLGLTGQV